MASLKSSLYATIALLFFCNISTAQKTLETAGEPPALDTLKGFTQTIYFSTGYQERAKHIARFMEDAGNYFQQEVGFTPATKIYILASQHWKAIAAIPMQDVYGFPHNIDDTRLAIAADDNDFWRSFLPAVDKLPENLASAVTEAYGNFDGSFSMMPFFDLLALHEMGHSYTAQAGLKMHRSWMGELFVNIMLHTYVAEKQPELLPALEVFPNMVLGAGTAALKYTSLQDFEKLYPTMGMGPQNYGWYQCKLHSAAKDIYHAGGKNAIQLLWTALKNHQENMTDEAFVSMLAKEVHPSVANVFLRWNKTD